MFRLSYRKIFLGMNVMPWWRSTTKESVKTFWGILTDTSIKQKLFFWKYQNFDIIHKQCRGEVVSNELLKYHQTVNQTQVSEYPSNDQENILSSAFRTDRKDTFFEKSIEKHF